MRKVFFVSCILLGTELFSQSAAPVKPCSAPESSQFDFWIGEWDLTYNDTMHATNSITREMDGCVVYEHFKDPATGLKGNSWSVYSPKTKKWQQTWVDNQGGYLILTGEMKDGKISLFTEPSISPKGKKIRYRMLYYNIKPDSFDWNWESTLDDGATWQPGWLIHYKRKK